LQVDHSLVPPRAFFVASKLFCIPKQKWKWLGRAERSEHSAEAPLFTKLIVCHWPASPPSEGHGVACRAIIPVVGSLRSAPARVVDKALRTAFRVCEWDRVPLHNAYALANPDVSASFHGRYPVEM